VLFLLGLALAVVLFVVATRRRRPRHEQPARAAERDGPAPLVVDETLSVLLRRQVPVRFDEPPRSWLGGLPRMPGDVPWPTGPRPEELGAGERPLHFVAQIACADLPSKLWGGLGPRDGWLLLFLDAGSWEGEARHRSVQVAHVRALGPERQPPPEIAPMRLEAFEGYDFNFHRSEEDIPPTWRRWPVDIVPVPTEPTDDAIWPASTPETIASMLYQESPIDPGPVTDLPSRMPPPPDEWPYTWRGALYVVDSVVRALATPHAVAVRDSDVQRIQSPGWVDSTIAAIDRGIAAVEQRLANLPAIDDATPADDAQRAADTHVLLLAQRNKLTRIRAFLHHDGSPLSAVDVVRRMRDSQRRYGAWRISRGPVLDEMRASILEHDLDGAMSAEEFRPFFDALSSDASEFWAMVHDHVAECLVPTPIDIWLVSLARRGFSAALSEVAADLYVTSPEKRALIPPSVLARCEPHWRALHDDRPHRMGGPPDGVQSTTTAGPPSRVLLFQLATDDALQWCWGDAGTWYVFIDPARLAAGDFSRIEAFLETP
jgi:hypothetical protein